MSMIQFSGSGAAVRAFQVNAAMLGGIQLETGANFTSLLVASGSQEDGPAWHTAQSKFQLSKSFSQASGSVIQALNYLKSQIASESEITFAEVSGALAPATSDIILGQGGQSNEVVIYGGTLGLLKDSSVLKFGTDEEITVTHAADAGLTLKNTNTGDDKPFALTIQTGETDIAADDVLGKIDFQAPDEGTGTDAILVAAGIEAVSEGDFAADNNATKLSFKTAASEAAAEKMKLSSTGVLTLNGGSGALVIPNDGNIGSAGDTDAIAISNAGVVSLSATTAATNTSTGALTVAGGVGIAADLFVGDDLALDSDAAVLSFGDDQDVTMTHVADSGLTLKNTSTGDDTPFVLTIQTGETDIAADDVLGKIDFQAPDEGTGTDAILVAAGIEAVSEGDFSATSNATKLSFKTAASEAASEKMSLSSAGNLTLANQGKIQFTDGNAFIHHDGSNGMLIQDDQFVQIAASGIQLGASSAQSTVVSGPATGSIGLSIQPARFQAAGESSPNVTEPALSISGNMFRHDGSTKIEVGASAASASLDMIPYLQIAGVDADGNLQNFKVQVSGGMLQLNQV